MIELPLTNSSIKALISDEDFILLEYNWALIKNGYVATGSTKFLSRLLHVIIADRMCMIRSEVDHENRIKHDCQRTNLRPSNRTLNCANRMYPTNSRFRGVFNRKNRFAARITYKGTCISLGTYDSEIAAAKAFNVAAVRLFGQHAILNNIFEEIL